MVFKLGTTFRPFLLEKIITLKIYQSWNTFRELYWEHLLSKEQSKISKKKWSPKLNFGTLWFCPGALCTFRTRHLWRFTLPHLQGSPVLFACFVLFCFVLFCLVLFCFVFVFYRQNDRKWCRLDYLDGFGFGEAEKNSRGGWKPPIGQTRVNTF